MPVRKHWIEIEWPNGVPSPADEQREIEDAIQRQLQRDNTREAIAQGIRVGQAAIAQILTGGPGPLGPKPTD